LSMNFLLLPTRRGREGRGLCRTERGRMASSGFSPAPRIKAKQTLARKRPAPAARKPRSLLIFKRPAPFEARKRRFHVAIGSCPFSRTATQFDFEVGSGGICADSQGGPDPRSKSRSAPGAGGKIARARGVRAARFRREPLLRPTAHSARGGIGLGPRARHGSHRGFKLFFGPSGFGEPSVFWQPGPSVLASGGGGTFLPPLFFSPGGPFAFRAAELSVFRGAVEGFINGGEAGSR